MLNDSECYAPCHSFHPGANNSYFLAMLKSNEIICTLNWHYLQFVVVVVTRTVVCFNCERLSPYAHTHIDPHAPCGDVRQYSTPYTVRMNYGTRYERMSVASMCHVYSYPYDVYGKTTNEWQWIVLRQTKISAIFFCQIQIHCIQCLNKTIRTSVWLWNCTSSICCWYTPANDWGCVCDCVDIRISNVLYIAVLTHETQRQDGRVV